MAKTVYVKKDRAAANSRSEFNKIEVAEARKAAEQEGADPNEAAEVTAQNQKKKEEQANKKYSSIKMPASQMFAGK